MIVFDYIKNVAELVMLFVIITTPEFIQKNFLSWFPVLVIDFGIHLCIVISIHVLLLNQHSYVGLEDKLRREIQEGGMQNSDFSENEMPKNEITPNETPEMEL